MTQSDADRMRRDVSPKLSIWQILSYGSLMLPLSMGWVTLMMIVPTYYALDLGLGLGLVGVLFAIGRGFDIITDPTVGILTDRTRTRFGRRKPWVILGLPLFCCAVYLLLKQTDSVTPLYLLLVSCLYFFSFTICEIPQAAMGLEMSEDPHERTVLASSKTLFLILGGLIGAAAPLIWTESTSQALSNVVTLIFIVSIIVMPIYLWLMPSDIASNRLPQPKLRAALKALRGHHEIQKIIGTFFILITAKSFGGALSLLYITYVLEMPKLVGLFWIGSGLGMLVGIPLWIILSRHIGKIRTWRIATLLGICGYVALLFLGVGDKVPMFIVSLILGVSGVADSVLSVSLLADQIGRGRRQGQPEFAGLVTAIKNASSKLSITFPMLIAFPILGFIGLTEGTASIGTSLRPVETHDRVILVGFYAGIPLLLKIAAYFAIGTLAAGKSNSHESLQPKS
ncbi:MFS transporter [Litorimonas sp. WD9-15]|uniref:MFS transporter n=1 Tax=Litorimonas sp. WD9-15 TaxID=3418716 RepID=UPI003CFCD529